MIVPRALGVRLSRVRDRLRDAPSEPVTLGELARLVQVSPFHLQRAFVHAYGESPHAYVTRLRLDLAKAKLRGGATVTEACFDAGFSSLGSFSATFREKIGVAPSEYARTLRRLVAVPSAIGAATVPFCFLSMFGGPASLVARLEKPLDFRP